MNNNILNVLKVLLKIAIMFIFCLQEYDPDLSEKIKEIKYTEHNKEWIENMM